MTARCVGWGLLALTLSFCGCNSSLPIKQADGTVLYATVGFGNEVDAGQYRIQPSKYLIDVGAKTLATAGEAAINRAMDKAAQTNSVRTDGTQTTNQ